MVSGTTSPSQKDIDKRPRRSLSRKQRKERDARNAKKPGHWRRGYKVPVDRHYLDVQDRAFTSQRDFFHLRTQEERRWYEMLEDAPSDYSPHWIDALQDPKLRAYLRQVYIQMREEQDDGSGVTVLRDLMLRRLLWCARIAARIEGVMEEYALKDMIEPEKKTVWQTKLFTAERYYAHLTEVMTDLCFRLHRTGPKRKKAAGSSAGRVGAGTVQIPVDDTE